MMLNLASRAYDRRWRIDPIVRSLLDTDFYKLLMLQMIWKHHADVPVTFSLINRSTDVRLAEIIERRELEAQLDHVRSLALTNQERIWLAGNTFYGTEGIFQPDFLAWLKTLRLPEYELRILDGQYELRFSGPWSQVMLWEIYAVTIRQYPAQPRRSGPAVGAGAGCSVFPRQNPPVGKAGPSG